YTVSTATALSGPSVLMGRCDLSSGVMSLWGDGAALDSTSIPTGAMGDIVPATGRIGSAQNDAQYFPGKIFCVMQLAADAAFPSSSLNRLQQYAGLCCGRNLGLSIA